MTVWVEHADMLQAIPRLVAEGVVCDSCVCDPPYHLVPNAKRWAPGRTESCDVEDGRYRRLSGGFMNQTWDGGDIAFRPETWATVAIILRPGAFLVAFGGCRTYHRMTCAIEDSGLVIQDCIMWLNGQGFPKRRDALKPAYEPVILAYKPGGKRTMQINECRVGTESTITTRSGNSGAQGIYGRDDRVFERENPPGRWPANICHDGSDEVLAAFAAYGESTSPPPRERSDSRERQSGFAMTAGSGGYSDSGSAARFFMSAKAGAQDRWGSRHPTVKPVELMKWLVALVTPPGGTVLDCFAGSGTTGVAALATGRDAILIEREANYYEDIKARLAHCEGKGVHSLSAKGRRRNPITSGGVGTPLFDGVAS